MDTETDILRKQIAEEVQAEFEVQLRDMRRQKNRAEEDHEEAAAKWRAEKRRLNDEVDRLETELMTAGKGSFSSSESSVNQWEIEEKIRKAAADWEAERERLISQIARLQSAVAEAIERSNNPMRSTQQIRDQFDAKLSEAYTQRLEMEQQLLRSKAAWEEEKKTLVNELIKVRRLTPANLLEVKEMYEKRKGRTETVEETRIHELETQLSEARSSILKYHETTMRSAQELATASKEAQGLKRTLAEMKEQIAAEEIAQVRREYEARMQELLKENLRLEQQLHTARSTGAGLPRPETIPAESSQPASTTGFNINAINSEVERVERVIKAIDELLDDPSTSASTISQKNVEKAELSAYQRGILFSLGRGKGI
jgi:hypothetical protein